MGPSGVSVELIWFSVYTIKVSPRTLLSQEIDNESGQALLEYVLSLVIAVALISAFSLALRRPVGRVWQRLAKEIAAPCPDCPGNDRIRF